MMPIVYFGLLFLVRDTTQYLIRLLCDRRKEELYHCQSFHYKVVPM